MGMYCSCRAKDQTAPDRPSNMTDRTSKETTTKDTCDNPYVNSDSSEADSYDGDTGADPDDDNRPPRITDQYSTERNKSGFLDAVEQGNDSLVDYFLREYPSLNLLEVEFENGDTCLHVAVRKRHTQLVFYLLQHGVSVW